MKSYLIILTWLVTFAALLGLACEPAASVDTDTEQVGIAEVSPETVVKPPEPVAAETPPEPTVAETPVKPEPIVAEKPVEPPLVVETPKEPPAPAQTTAEKADKVDVAVTVNGIDITESQIDKKIAPQMERMANQPGRKLPPSLMEQSRAQLKQRIIEEMIVETLLDEKVKENNIVITEEDVTNQINKMLAQGKMSSLDDLKALLEARGTNYDQWKEQMQFPKRLAYQRVMEAQFDDQVNITEEDAQKYYSENIKQFEQPEQVRVSHILVRPDTTDPNTDPNDAKAQAMAKTQNLLEQIRTGADFAELAKTTGGYPSAPKGGDIGFGQKSDLASGRRGSWVGPFEKAAFELEVGQVSDVVETTYGYHIIKVTDHKDAGVTTFEEVKKDLINMLKQRKQNELARQYIEDLKAEATIVYPPGKEPKPVQKPAFPGAPVRRSPR
ncbi:MAG: peptidylprolyl isomerase [Planctomycetota bacterium]|jgi:peptidyl-prolyl cis-trans isomerase C